MGEKLPEEYPTKTKVLWIICIVCKGTFWTMRDGTLLTRVTGFSGVGNKGEGTDLMDRIFRYVMDRQRMLINDCSGWGTGNPERRGGDSIWAQWRSSD